jgi:hypothetical protein
VTVISQRQENVFSVGSVRSIYLDNRNRRWSIECRGKFRESSESAVSSWERDLPEFVIDRRPWRRRGSWRYLIVLSR